MSAAAKKETEPASAAVIEAKQVTRILDTEVPVTLVRDIDLEIGRGEFISVTGPSGSGKSSLLYLLGLLDLPTTGSVLLEGRDTSTLSDAALADLRLRRLGFVFQFHFLLPEFRVIDNVMLPMRKLGALSNQAMHDRAEQLLADLDMAEQMKKRPDQLSGGQRQRVAVARALANEPMAILADEPTGNLDTRNARVVFDILAGLSEKQGTAIVAVTHDPDLADLAHRRVHLVDGRIVSD